MISTTRHPVAISVVLAGLLGLVACSSDSSKHGSGGFFVSQLGQVPQSVGGDTVELYAADLDAASSLAHVDRPANGTTGEPLTTWLADISGPSTGAPVNVVLPQAVSPTRVAQADEIVAELGWSVSNVHRYIEYAAPPYLFSVLTGTFSAKDITAAVGDPANGIWSIGADDNGVDIDAVTAARPLGESLRFALEGDQLAVSRATPSIAAWKALSSAGAKSLVDDPALLSVASALDGTRAYAAYLLEEDFSVPHGKATPAQVAAANAGASLGTFTAAGIGLWVDSAVPMGVLVYVYPDAATATSGAAGLRQLLASGSSLVTARPWSDQLKAPHVTIDGSVVTATFSFHDMAPTSFWSIALRRDNLLTSAG